VDKNGNHPSSPNERWYDAETGRLMQKGLSQVVAMWPTPTANDNDNRRSKPTPAELEGRHGWSLKSAVVDAGSTVPNKRWPTPRSTEWKGTGPPGSKSQLHRLKKKYLDATIQHAEVGEEDTSERVPPLNPDWVDLLMGWPMGWSSLGGLMDGMRESRNSQMPKREETGLVCRGMAGYHKWRSSLWVAWHNFWQQRIIE